MKIGKKIKEIRELNSLSQIRLSEISKVAQSSISEYETGVTEPSLRTLFRLAKALEVPLTELLNEPTGETNRSFLL